MKPTRLPLPTKNRISLLMLMLCICVPDNALGVEELDYELISQFGDIEIRSYKAHELATVNIESGFTRAGYSAFRYLFKYISGENQEQKKIAMTAPVLQRPGEIGWSVSFVMPQSEKTVGMPNPNSNQVIKEQIQPSLMAAIKYSGSWRKSRFLNYKEKLIKGIEQTRYEICGPAIWARFDPPFSLPFMRRNEVIAKVCFQNPN